MHKITFYEIRRLEKNSAQFDYMDKRIICDDNFYGLYLCFDNGYELSFLIVNLLDCVKKLLQKHYTKKVSETAKRV